MKKMYFSVMYVLLTAAALLIAGGAPIPWLSLIHISAPTRPY